jgi:hypothetical protein
MLGGTGEGVNTDYSTLVLVYFFIQDHSLA